jgi:hypothetical protein
MSPLSKAPPPLATRKLKDCLRWAQMRTERRAWLPPSNLTMRSLAALLVRQRYRCALTGLPLTLSGPQSMSIDRIDGPKGYRHRNVRLVAKFANAARGQMSDAAFQAWWRDLEQIPFRLAHIQRH